MAQLATNTTLNERGQDRTKRPEPSHDQQVGREMVFVPFEGFAGIPAKKAKVHRNLSGSAQTAVESVQDDMMPYDAILGTSMMNPSTERHIAMMRDPRFTHSTNIGQSARIVDRLHQTYGNHYVQMVTKHVQSGNTRQNLATLPVSLQPPTPTLQRNPGERSKGRVKIVSGDTQYHDVAGATLADICKQLGTTEWGRCEWNARINYKNSSKGIINRVDVTMTISYRMPRWKGNTWEKASAPAKKEWKRMIGCLWKHEKGHASIYRKEARAFRRALLGKPAADFAGTYEQLKHELDTKDKVYDAKTQHGQTQGVNLDISIK